MGDISKIDWTGPARLCLRRDADASKQLAAWDARIAEGSLAEMVCEAMSRGETQRPWLVIEAGQPVRQIPFSMIRILWKLPDCPICL